MNRYTYYGISAIGIAALGAAAITMAQTSSTPNNTPSTSTTITTPTIMPAPPAPKTHQAPMVVHISNAGEALVRGTVRTIGTDSITIDAWGGVWTVRTFSSSIVIPRGIEGVSDLSQLKVGDFIGAQGTVDTDQSFTVNAQIVRDWTTNPSMGSSGY